MKPTCYIAINGIHSDPGAADGWTDRFVSWLHWRRGARDYVAEKYEYHTNWALRWVRQGARAKSIGELVAGYEVNGYRVVMVGHSNGCDLIGRVLAAGIAVDAVHLIAPATDEVLFEEAIKRGTVRRIHTYGSRNDQALKLAWWSKPFLGWARLGYGSMGLRCREFAARFPAVVTDHSNDALDHSDWFKASAATGFEPLMRQILTGDEGDQLTWTGEGIATL